MQATGEGAEIAGRMRCGGAGSSLDTGCDTLDEDRIRENHVKNRRSLLRDSRTAALALRAACSRIT